VLGAVKWWLKRTIYFKTYKYTTMGIKNVRIKENSSENKNAPSASVQSNQRMVTVLNQPIQVGEANRGNKTIKEWLSAVKSAERRINPRRYELIEIYKDIVIDGTLRAVMEKRIRAVSTTPFIWEGLDNDALIDNFASPWFTKMIQQIMSYRFWGSTVIELFQNSDGHFNETKILPRENVIPHQGIVTDHVLGTSGRSYREDPAANWILEIGEPDELGLLANIAPYVLMKRDNLGFWATYNEVFGMPFRVYYYNPNDPSARAKSIEQAKSQGALAWAVLPEDQARVEFLKDGTSSGTSNGAYQALLEALNKEITITVLGQTLTTGTDGKGSYALGGIHKAVEEGVNLEDRMWVEYIMNYQFREKAIIHGYPLDGIKGYFQEVERVSSEKKQEMWNAAIEKGLPIAEEDYYNEFGIPHPDSKNTIKLTSTNKVDLNEHPKPPKKKSELTAQLTKLYKPFTTNLKIKKTGGIVTMSLQDDFEKVWETIIEKLHNGQLQSGDVDQELFNLISQQLTKALDQGYSKNLSQLELGSRERELFLALRENLFVFSGFKTYQELRQASELLITETGAFRSFADFKAEVLKLNQQYNINYLETEYNMAVANSQMAEQWQQFEENKEAAPYLKYRSVNDEVARHKAYDGII
ncbi:MAG: DUF935 family protein, partial [Bacteroidota bacterium]